MSDFEKRWWGDELVKSPKVDTYGDEYWFGGDGCGQVIIGEWVSGGGRTSNPRRWATLLKQSELIAAALGHYAEHRSCPFASLADAQAEIARLRGALEKCQTALSIAAAFAEGCPVEDAIQILSGQDAARDALK